MIKVYAHLTSTVIQTDSSLINLIGFFIKPVYQIIYESVGDFSCNSLVFFNSLSEAQDELEFAMTNAFLKRLKPGISNQYAIVELELSEGNTVINVVSLFTLDEIISDIESTGPMIRWKEKKVAIKELSFGALSEINYQYHSSEIGFKNEKLLGSILMLKQFKEGKKSLKEDTISLLELYNHNHIRTPAIMLHLINYGLQFHARYPQYPLDITLEFDSVVNDLVDTRVITKENVRGLVSSLTITDLIQIAKQWLKVQPKVSNNFFTEEPTEIKRKVHDFERAYPEIFASHSQEEKSLYSLK